ncbi:putative F-box and FNIP repeat-containing protein [Megavirus lba]|uniref:Putative F-box and FNIP repeat-containing protein n=1 Tax=Megavirus lba TaxID=1235314 RepID=L7Y464_9VIRU|nr:putative F-box and FNIP repeat-containing protein [Megavirus lba]
MSITDILNTDTIVCILDFFKDCDKMNFMKTCKEYYDFRNNINYTNLYECDVIKNLSIVNRFKRLIYRGKIPNNNTPFNEFIKEYIITDLINPIPNSVTHLTFNREFNKNIKLWIPNTVTHLLFLN